MISIEIATRAADAFTRLYYTTYDSPTRVDDLPKFYRSSSTLTWNGNPCQGAEGVKKLIQDMPSTKHEVQSYDCHPIPGLFLVMPCSNLNAHTYFISSQVLNPHHFLLRSLVMSLMGAVLLAIQYRHQSNQSMDSLESSSNHSCWCPIQQHQWSKRERLRSTM